MFNLFPYLRNLKLPLISLLLAGFMMACQAAEAPQAEPFSEARLKALQAENTLVLVDITADWCSTCRKQKAILAKFQKTHPDAKLNVLTVDFDKQKDWVIHFKAPRQSTFVLFKGATQRWFAVAETREDVIFDELLRAAAP
ncbi:MAG: thioredoxin family protein [Pseudomonadota bacterium]